MREPYLTTIAKVFRPQPLLNLSECHPCATKLPKVDRVGDRRRYFELADACTKGDSDRLHQLLLQTRGGVPQTHDPTPLVLAVIYEHDACALLLIAWGSCLNVRCGPDLETALHVSCARGNVEITKALLEANADHRAVDAHGRSPLLIACLTDQPACASLLLESGADAEQPMAGDNPGATPLYAAACAGSLRCASLLCEAGARVNARTKNGASPMLVASQDGHLHVAMLLSSYGAERGPDYLDDTGVVVMPSEAERLARESGNKELHLWIKSSYRYSALHHVRVLTPQRAIGLLRAGCSPHARTVRAGPVAAWTEVRDWPEGAASPDSMFQSPAELAREHEHDPRVPAATIILRAAEPWSPDTHQLWGARQREHAVQLYLIGYQLAAKTSGSQQGGFVDAWLDCVMPLAVSWSSCQACAPAPDGGEPRLKPPSSTRRCTSPLDRRHSRGSRRLHRARREGAQ